MTREEIILSHIKRDGLSLEIGAGCSPIAPKKQGSRVQVLDHCDRKALIGKYRPHGINLDNIEDVDFIWDGRSYTELVGPRHVYVIRRRARNFTLLCRARVIFRRARDWNCWGKFFTNNRSPESH